MRRNIAIPTSIVRTCGRCGQRNRVPISALARGRYTCGACGATIAYSDRPPFWLAAPTVLWIAVLLVIGISNAYGPETWWFGAANLYFPQIVYALPAVVILPAYAIWSRRWLLLPIAALLYTLGPLMGFTWSFPRDPLPAPHIRVMTYNAKWGMHGADGVAEEIRKANPDIVQFQDSSNLMCSTYVASALAGYNVRTDGQYIVASKFPISKIQRVDISFKGREFYATRVWVRMGGTGFALYDVHLFSPRSGLVGFRKQDIEPIIVNTRDRVFQAQRLAYAMALDRGPAIVTGDLNSPVQGLACRYPMSAGYRDAFEEAGRGYGYSYGQYTKVGQPYVRIDHILVSRHWTVVRCWTGGIESSEHIPVCAVIALTRAK
ncbi:MAG: endonuclease/exonuclease/phosphatase family protein [Capsulimonadaceae bacterium]|nr:endonuclease/exonuclease/phosphatase family protein [Capsulimonadaceae bacterium]